jgi:hypothetical protein
MSEFSFRLQIQSLLNAVKIIPAWCFAYIAREAINQNFDMIEISFYILRNGV